MSRGSQISRGKGWWSLMVGLLVFGLWAGLSLQAASGPSSFLSEGEIASQPSLSPDRRGEVGQTVTTASTPTTMPSGSCWDDFGDVIRAGNVTVSSSSTSSSSVPVSTVSTLPEVFFVAGTHSRNNVQYLVRYAAGDVDNCAGLSSLSVDPVLPAELMLRSDGDGIFVELEEFLGPIVGVRPARPAGVVAETPMASYVVSATDLDGDVVSFSVGLEVVADVAHPNGLDAAPSFHTPSVRDWGDGDSFLRGEGVMEGFHWKLNEPINPLSRKDELYPGNLPYTYSLPVGSVLPAGIVLDPVSGVISGTPTEVVTDRVVRVRIDDWDGDGLSSREMRMTVSVEGPSKETHNAPVVDSEKLADIGDFLVRLDPDDDQAWAPTVIDLDEFWSDQDSHHDIGYEVEEDNEDIVAVLLTSLEFVAGETLFDYEEGVEWELVEGEPMVGNFLKVSGVNPTVSGNVTVRAWGVDDVPRVVASELFQFDVVDRPARVIGEIMPNPLRLPPGASRTFLYSELEGVGKVFEDKDEGGILGFNAVSDDVSVVTAGSVNNDRDVLITVADGASDGSSVTVTITPTGYRGVNATVEVVVDSTAPAPPRVDMVIEDLDLELDGAGSWTSRSWNLYDHFSDPNGGRIVFTETVTTSDDVTMSIVTAEIVESMDQNGDPVATLTVSGDNKGSAFVDVVATDVDGVSVGSANIGFTVRTLDRPPTKVSDTTANVAPDSSTQVALAPLFSDPDGDEMTFDVEKTSGDATITHTDPAGGVLTVVASASAMVDETATFTITPRTVQVGVTVTHDVSATVTATVVDPNAQLPPRVKATPGSIPNQPISVSNREFVDVTLDLDTYFEDPNDDAITYSASSDDTSVATVAVSGSMLMISGESPGSAQVTVNTRDATAAGATLRFRVTVPDRPPFKATDPEAESIPIGGMRTVSLTSVFEDPDGDTLTFEGTTSDSLVAIVAPAAGGVLITVRDDATEGATATITVNPQDHSTVTATIDVMVTAATTNPTVPSTNPTVPSTTPATGGVGNPGVPGLPPSGGGAPTGQPPTTQPPSSGTGFSDSVGTTHEDNINRLAESGITRGCNPPTNSRFCPDRAVTRGEMATFMVRSFDLAESTSNLFADDNGNTHESNINAFAAAGITRGCNPPENTRYCPDRPVTRAQMATFLARAMDLAEGTGDFEDTVGSPHADDINRIASVGITRGCNPPENSRYCPDRAVTRGEMATFLIRAEDIANS